MKFKIQAGAEIDVLTRKEMREDMGAMMRSWLTENARGDRYRRFAMFGDSAASGAVTIGAQGTIVGPPAGVLWSVKALAVTSGFDPASHRLRLSISSAESSAIVHPDLELYTSFDQNQLVLRPGDTLVITGTSTASTRVWVTGSFREMPESLEWRLG